ncbi:hypothetical protein BJX65DRAFT_10595 [Aspergillus insuetus]
MCEWVQRPKRSDDEETCDVIDSKAKTAPLVEARVLRTRLSSLMMPDFSLRTYQNWLVSPESKRSPVLSPSSVPCTEINPAIEHEDKRWRNSTRKSVPTCLWRSSVCFLAIKQGDTHLANTCSALGRREMLDSYRATGTPATWSRKELLHRVRENAGDNTIVR